VGELTLTNRTWLGSLDDGNAEALWVHRVSYGSEADIAHDVLAADTGQTAGSRWLTCHVPQ